MYGRPYRVRSRVSVWVGLLCAVVSAAMLLSIVIALVLIILAGDTLDDNKEQDTELIELRDRIDRWEQGCEEQKDEILERIEILEEPDPNDICLNGLCTRFPSNAHMLNLVGCWDATTNDPALQNGTGLPNEAYIVCTDGATLLDGNDDWAFGDFVIFSPEGDAWIKNDGSVIPLPPAGNTPAHITHVFNWTCDGFGVGPVEVEFFLISQNSVEVHVPLLVLEVDDDGLPQCALTSTAVPDSSLFPVTSGGLEGIMRPHVTIPLIEGLEEGDSCFGFVGPIELLVNGTFRIFEELDQNGFGPYPEDDFEGPFGSWGYEFVYDV